MSPSKDHKRIFLTGYMGAGKSTVGRLLASRLGYGFVDTDRKLVSLHEKPVSQIFREHGEPFFRQAELELLTELVDEDHLVISTGGGTLTREETLAVIRDKGIVVYLRAPVEQLFERVIFSPKDRPMIDVPDAEKVFRERFEKRCPFYERADLIIDTAGKKPRDVMKEILATPLFREIVS